uniref:Ring finger protein 151 n=1 Tax=Nothobranchius pienaari TaxID=704102 RepID=A0A1A8QC93_9TELE
MADPDVSTQSGGYDVELFVDPPDYDLICTICQGVLRCPAQHNCYKQLRQEYEARQQNHRTIAAALQRKMKRMQCTMVHMRRQIRLICESLEVIDDLHEVEEEDLGESSGSSSGTPGNNS